ncbi:hypothetical protein [Vallicoccus soli]|uniref:Uncharacterized protein n=1 Tax=Vallicoccus soli TaxID=2339232 RepID=A0A3A3ZD26_9ACTN|nr:hypothetical protein [Vallicoccus soli]RJK92926.1 hypothetical protein D5H78_17550 [Vallicoccus soli]
MAGIALTGLSAPATSASGSDEVQTRVTVSVDRTTVTEGGSVRATAKVTTLDGKPYTEGAVQFGQVLIRGWCDGPSVPVDGRGVATALVPLISPTGGGVEAQHYVGEIGEGGRGYADVDVAAIDLPVRLQLNATDAYPSGQLIYGATSAQQHYNCVDSDDDWAYGTVDFYRGGTLLASGWSAADDREDWLEVQLPAGRHQVRGVFTPTWGWSTATATMDVSVAVDGTTTTSDELVRNPSFESDLAGWGAHGGTLTRVTRAGAPDGAAVVRASRGSGTVFSVSDTRQGAAPTVSATTRGATYVASAHVAAATSASVGRTATLILRERTPAGSLVKETKVPVKLTTGWQRLAVAAQATATGNDLGVRVEQSGAAAGHAFFADAISLEHATTHVADPHTVVTSELTHSVWTGLSANAKRVSLEQVPVGRDLGSITAYVDGLGASSGSQVLRGVVYADAGGAPGRLVASSEPVTVRAGRPAGPLDLPVTKALRLTEGRYWVGLHSGTTGGVARYLSQVVPGTLRTNSDAYSDGATATFGASTVDGKDMLLWPVVS